LRNIEAKWRCGDLEAIARRAATLGARDGGVIEQEDLFFPCAAGRLKLRRFDEGRGELIAYRRADRREGRASEYEIYATTQPDLLARVMSSALGRGGRVRKHRRLLLIGHSRIHLDEVDGLGPFVEIETVVREQPEGEARREFERIAAALGLTDSPEASAYVELLEARASAAGGARAD
jgi:predicted adenylyl cyclase CyaB